MAKNAFNRCKWQYLDGYCARYWCSDIVKNKAYVFDFEFDNGYGIVDILPRLNVV